MAKDRARPFSRKHRKYWLTILGGMVVISIANVAIGMCSYERGPEHVQRLDLVIPKSTIEVNTRVPVPPGMLPLGDIPVPVIRAFNTAYPQRAPKTAKKLDDGTIEITFVEQGQRKSARFAPDGTQR